MFKLETKIKELVESIRKINKPLGHAALLKAQGAETLPSMELLAKQFSFPYYTDLSGFLFVINKITPLSYAFAKNRLVLSLEEKEGSLVVAMLNPFDWELLEEIRYITQKPIQIALSTKQALEEGIELTYHQKDNEASEYIASLKVGQTNTEEDAEEGYDLLEKGTESPVVRLLNMILTEAVQQGASDIHFEPMEKGLGVRYRIDGVLQERHSPPKELQGQLITRVKVMARLDIAEHRLPQDGRIKLKMGGRQIDFRVSTVPVVFGERIVLRILDRSHVVLGLQHIGMDTELLAQFSQLVCLSEGIVLVTGPTGSGKTTTLYSALSEINSSEVNIMTIEDPVEYKLQGMAQIGVNPKIHLTFATGLRHILRQDPDVIMIGEIRDKETAEIAIQASLTGHLVLSTLHTNDAPSALTRLVDMGIEPYLLTSSVAAVLAQRLLRTICSYCKEGYEPTDQELRELGIDRADLAGNQLFRGKGCPHCFGAGFKGRRGIYELMPMSSSIKRQLLESPDAVQLKNIAYNEGMRSLRSQGARLAILGVTASSEVLRVTREVGE
ncbi:MAG: ral secretion pathway protein [Chlamydiota bacterium]|jgi:general secretion pathway protein E